jgi:hypothetical protein
MHRHFSFISFLFIYFVARKVSVTKKPNDNGGVTPLHLAAINPNPKYLKELLDVVPDYNRADARMQYQIIHYAAACEGLLFSDPFICSFECLQILYFFSFLFFS